MRCYSSTLFSSACFCAVLLKNGDACFLKGDSGVAQPVCSFAGDDLFDGIPAQRRSVRATALTLEQDADRACDRHDVHTVILLRSQIHRL